MKLALAVFVVGIAACGSLTKSTGAPPAPPSPLATCADVDAPFQNMADNLRAQITADMNAVLAKVIAETADAQPKAAAIACRQDVWTSEQIRCYVDARTVGAWNTCDQAMTGVQRVSFDLYVQAFSDPSAPTATDWPWQPVAASTGTPACDDYLTAVDAYMTCVRIPEPSRQAAARIYRGLAAKVRASPSSDSCEAISRGVATNLERAGC